MRGPYWTPITPLRGSLLHADPHHGSNLLARIIVDVTGQIAPFELVYAAQDLALEIDRELKERVLAGQ